MKLNSELTDEAVIAEIGTRMAHQRLLMDMTQATLARKAGVSRSTIERLEAGASVQLTNLVRVLRCLELLDRLDATLPAVEPTPIELLERGGTRQRARGRTSHERPEPDDWQWGDER